jgi:predicted DNA-binding mobile mystery protein A
MNLNKSKLIIDQLDRRFSSLKNINELGIPSEGWVRTIRTVLKMSLRQLGMRLGISAQSVKEIEQREVDGSLTLKSLREVANALEMKVVYVVIPKDESIEKLIERKANEIAREIVLRTSNTMMLEEQEVSNHRIEKAIKEKAEEIKNKMPKYLWD